MRVILLPLVCRMVEVCGHFGSSIIAGAGHAFSPTLASIRPGVKVGRRDLLRRSAELARRQQLVAAIMHIVFSPYSCHYHYHHYTLRAPPVLSVLELCCQ